MPKPYLCRAPQMSEKGYSIAQARKVESDFRILTTTGGNKPVTNTAKASKPLKSLGPDDDHHTRKVYTLYNKSCRKPISEGEVMCSACRQRTPLQQLIWTAVKISDEETDGTQMDDLELVWSSCSQREGLPGGNASTGGIDEDFVSEDWSLKRWSWLDCSRGSLLRFLHQLAKSLGPVTPRMRKQVSDRVEYLHQEAKSMDLRISNGDLSERMEVLRTLLDIRGKSEAVPLTLEEPIGQCTYVDWRKQNSLPKRCTKSTYWESRSLPWDSEQSTTFCPKHRAETRQRNTTLFHGRVMFEAISYILKYPSGTTRKEKLVNAATYSAKKLPTRVTESHEGTKQNRVTVNNLLPKKHMQTLGKKLLSTCRSDNCPNDIGLQKVYPVINSMTEQDLGEGLHNKRHREIYHRARSAWIEYYKGLMCVDKEIEQLKKDKENENTDKNAGKEDTEDEDTAMTG